MQLVTFERGRGKATSATARSALQDAYGEHEDLEDAPAGGLRLGALLGDSEVVDLNRALALKLSLDDAGAPEAEADSLLPSDALAYLRALPDAAIAAREVLSFVNSFRDRYDGPDLAALGVIEPRRALRLHAPVPRPGKIIGVARNYPAHVAEQGEREASAEPVLFLKASSAVTGPDSEIQLGDLSQQVDYEGELAVVIGSRARGVSREIALGHVAGYCAANDVSARDYQGVRGQAFIGKSFDSFAPLGPALVTPDEIPDPQTLSLRTTLCGQVVQSASTKEMRFSVAELIAFASRMMTLEPGDVLLTGTPAGVGKARRPPRYLRDGDVVEVQIERIGTLRNHVRGAARSKTP